MPFDPWPEVEAHFWRLSKEERARAFKAVLAEVRAARLWLGVHDSYTATVAALVEARDNYRKLVDQHDKDGW